VGSISRVKPLGAPSPAASVVRKIDVTRASDVPGVVRVLVPDVEQDQIGIVQVLRQPCRRHH